MDKYREAVIRWMRARVPFTLVEERINGMEELSEDQRSALWLYGWSLQPRHTRMAEAEATLNAMAELRPREPLHGHS